MVYITSSGSTTVAKAANGILVQINKTAAGTITLAAGGATFAIIDTPLVGQSFRYNGLRGLGAITVNPSGTTDITVSFLNREV